MALYVSELTGAPGPDMDGIQGDVTGATGPLSRDQCEIIADDLALPGAITFDRHGTLWVVENHIGAAPSIHPVAMP
ncbi:MAG: hypothetical protein ACN0LA_07765 [Candidatus Longimicrobiales bacterium M2_2A_002]